MDANSYVVYRVHSGGTPNPNWQNPELRDQVDNTVPLNGTDIAQFTEKVEAIEFCRHLRARQSELVMLGVQFSAAYTFVVRGQKFNGTGGIRAWRVVLNSEDADVEYEDDEPRPAPLEK